MKKMYNFSDKFSEETWELFIGIDCDLCNISIIWKGFLSKSIRRTLSSSSFLSYRATIFSFFCHNGIMIHISGKMKRMWRVLEGSRWKNFSNFQQKCYHGTIYLLLALTRVIIQPSIDRLNELDSWDVSPRYGRRELFFIYCIVVDCKRNSIYLL